MNATFEAAAAVAVLASVARARRERRVAGVSRWTVAFFTVCGAWNLTFYPWVGCPWSAAAAWAVTAANAWYLWLLWRYDR